MLFLDSEERRMFVNDGGLVWSASDLVEAARCDFAVLRRLDTRLGRAPAVEVAADPLGDHIADLGERHERQILEELRARVGTDGLVVLGRSAATDDRSLRMLHAQTLAALDQEPEVVFQAGFYDGELHGYADFVRRTPDGWQVSDAKLARQARPQALLQLGAYADQLQRAGLPVARDAVLLLGDGRAESFPLADVLPVFRHRRERLRELLATHLDADVPVAWGTETVTACGRCAACGEAAAAHDDLVLVAGLRIDQRRRLREAGVTTMHELAGTADPPEGLRPATFETLRAQAALQVAQVDAGPGEDGRPIVSYELRHDAASVLGRLPAPSPGDLFFDFEGDPLHNEGDLTRWGLEYLWGFLEPGPSPEQPGAYHALWAHSASEEKVALAEFLDLVAERRAVHPDLHVYHYAAYEVTALKRLVALHQTHEDVLDDLLRSGVFVDLYATVRGAVRVSQPSYSIKRLEPLYMGDNLREGDVQSGDVSIAEYHSYVALAVAGDEEGAARRLQELESYNAYDCLSTLRLRDWLLERAEEAGLPAPSPHAAAARPAPEPEHDELVEALLERARPQEGVERTPEQQAHALLAAAVRYHRREDRPSWWAHFSRLARPLAEWEHERDVFVVHDAHVVDDWERPTPRSHPRRRLRLTGSWAPGSTPGTKVRAVYDLPGPTGCTPTEDAHCVAGGDLVVEHGEDPHVLTLVESAKPGEEHQDLPLALVPPAPISARPIPQAIAEVAAAAASAATLPAGPSFDVLARREPRLVGLERLPRGGEPVDDIVAALLALQQSYLAVQGPPGTGKTYTASRVVRRLVEEHHWRIGVVAQSHAVVEHVLDALVECGLDPSLVGKGERKHSHCPWTDFGKDQEAAFLAERSDTGGVVGGTAWVFANDRKIGRGELDLLVVDEAGQFALAPTIGTAVSAQRLLLLGDPQQLPQVSQGTHPEPVDTSALGWLMHGHDTLPEQFGYFLGTSHRMHPALCEKVSVLSYDGRLEAAPQTKERSLSGVEPGLLVRRLDHQHNRSESPEEAQEVLAQVQRLLGATWTDEDGQRPLGQQDILVVAPYNAQVALIRRTLTRAGLGDIQVGTVDRFQGRQAPVVLMSMTASSQGDVPRGMDFLLDRHRINVAVSRAKWLAVLVMSDRLTSYLPTSTEGLLELGAFLGLCED